MVECCGKRAARRASGSPNPASTSRSPSTCRRCSFAARTPSILSYLRRLPIDKLKIDRSFVRDLPTSPTDESIIRAIVSLAHSVGLQVVAEGVETAEQLERIRALDCDQWQGYHGCAPQPAAELAERLAADSALSSTGLRAALTRASRLLGP